MYGLLLLGLLLCKIINAGGDTIGGRVHHDRSAVAVLVDAALLATHCIYMYHSCLLTLVCHLHVKYLLVLLN